MRRLAFGLTTSIHLRSHKPCCYRRTLNIDEVNRDSSAQSLETLNNERHAALAHGQCHLNTGSIHHVCMFIYFGFSNSSNRIGLRLLKFWTLV
jgi:hypothetical protein